MKRLKPLFAYTGIFAALLLALYLLTVLLATVPNAAIRSNMLKSARYFMMEDGYAKPEDGLYQKIADNYADQIWTNIAWNLGSDDPFRTVLTTKYYDGQGYDDAACLYIAVSRNPQPNADYSRYWHGPAAIIRVLHMFTHVQGIKNLGFILLLLFIGRTLLALAERGRWELALCLVISLICVQFWNLRLSLEYLPSFLICFALCPLYLSMERRGDLWLMGVAVAAGTLTAFYDFLTTETVTILIPLILVVAVRSRERRLGSPGQVLRMLLGCGACWLLAYAATFLVKWVGASMVTGENLILGAMASAENRVNGLVTDGQLQVLPNALMAVGANLSVLFESTSRTQYSVAFGPMLVIAALGFGLFRMIRMRRKIYPGTYFLLLLGAVVLVRYGVLTNHSYMHAFFTYRALAGSVLAVLSAMALNL